jgi:sugar phosphate isomerase/epimerase
MSIPFFLRDYKAKAVWDTHLRAISVMSRKFGYRLSCLKSIPFSSAIALLVGIGYEGVELCLEHPDLEVLKAEKIDAVLEANKIVATAVSFHTKYASLEIKREKCQYGIKLARTLGIKTFISGAPIAKAEQEYERMLTFTQEMCALAWEKGIDFAVEAEPGTTIPDYASLQRLMREVGSSNLKINFDIGHFFISENSLTETIALGNKHIVHTHIEDIKDKKHLHLIPGIGDIVFPTVFQAFDDINYQGFFVLDLSEDAENPALLAQTAIQAINKL